jgi:hypothetical protein
MQVSHEASRTASFLRNLHVGSGCEELILYAAQTENQGVGGSTPSLATKF